MKKISNLIIILLTILTIMIAIASTSCSYKINSAVEVVTCVPEFPLVVIDIFPDKDLELATYRTIDMQNNIFYFTDQLGKFCQGDRLTIEYVTREKKETRFRLE